MANNSETLDLAETLLLEIIKKNPDDWESRKKLAQLLYDEGKAKYAAEIIWDAPEIPPIDLELGFAIKVLAKGIPRRAIRLLTFLQESNEGKPVQNLGIANALLHYGLVMQAARFYGAAVAGDSSLANPDLEHFLLWVDDTEKLWGDFENDKPDIGTLPWMKRDAEEADQLRKAMEGFTTPIRIPNLKKVTSEDIVNDFYVQSNKLQAEVTPPPAVSIPIEQLNPKDIVYDNDRGAAAPVSTRQAAAKKAAQALANPLGSTSQQLPGTKKLKTPLPMSNEPPKKLNIPKPMVKE